MIFMRTKQIDILINSIIVVICIVHVSLTGYNVLFPELPSFRIQEKTLENIEFPLFIQVCVSEIKRTDMFTQLGYDHEFDFYFGKSAYNDSLFGWNGHLQNGSTIGTVEGIQCFKDFSKDRFFRYSYKCYFSIRSRSSLN